MKMSDQKKFCVNCGASIDVKAEICPKCGVRQPITSNVSGAWWFASIFLGVVGGYIGYISNKDKDPVLAKKFLGTGLVVTSIFIGGFIGLQLSMLIYEFWVWPLVTVMTPIAVYFVLRLMGIFGR